MVRKEKQEKDREVSFWFCENCSKERGGFPFQERKKQKTKRFFFLFKSEGCREGPREKRKSIFFEAIEGLLRVKKEGV